MSNTMIFEAMEPVSRKPVSERVAMKLLDLIRTGNLNAGDMLPTENQLAAALQVSRPVVREALRGLSQAEGRRRAMELLEGAGLGEVAMRPIRTLSKGQAQTVQLLGTIVHKPRLLVLDEPFSGLDAINQQRLEGLIRAEVAEGATVLFSTHVIAHAERLCERITVIARGGVRFDGSVAEARDRLPSRVQLRTRRDDGPWRASLPADTTGRDREWSFVLPPAGIEPVLEALIAGGAGIEALQIERPSLHEAFVDLVGEPVDPSDDEELAA